MPSCTICSSDPRKEKVSLFRIPYKEWMRQRWNKVCNRNFTDSDRMCNKHFLKTDFINQPGSCKVARLLPSAVPSIFFDKDDCVVSKSLLSHQLKHNSLNLKEKNERKNKEIETLIEKNLMERFGFSTEDPIGEEQTIFSEDLVDEERTLSADEPEMALEDCQIDDHNIRKCGHILYNMDEEVFTLNCFFCSTICLDLIAFSEHVKKQHNNLSKQQIENPIDVVFDIKNTNNAISQYKNIYIETTDKGSNLMYYIETEVSSEPMQYSNFDSELNVDNKENDGLSSSSSDVSDDEEYNTTESNKQTEDLGIELNNRPLILNFIRLLKRKPFIFWNKEHQFKKRKIALKSICDTLGEKFPHLKFTYENVSALMYAMRAAYQSELKTIKVTCERDIDYVPQLWFFNKLRSFDCDYNAAAVQKKIESFKVIAMQLPFNIYNVSSTDNEMITLQIIDHYEKQPHLWNIDHPNYSDKFADGHGLQEFFEFVSLQYPDNIQITLKEFQAALEQMHRWFGAEENIRLNMERLNESFNSYYPQIYKALEFLRGHTSPFRCNICAKVFQRGINFVLHKKCCNTVQVCKHCHKQFTSLKNLSFHMKVHSNERLYLCTFCGNKYSTKASLRYHVGRRHNEIKFNCDECQRSYHSHNSLRIHQKSHLGIKDYICDLCGKGFTSSKYLYNHRSNHFAEKKRKLCNRCGKTFQAAFFKAHKENCNAPLKIKVTNLRSKKKQAPDLKSAEESEKGQDKINSN